MESYLTSSHYDLVTPDGRIEKWQDGGGKRREADVVIEAISPAFVGYDLDAHSLFLI